MTERSWKERNGNLENSGYIEWTGCVPPTRKKYGLVFGQNKDTPMEQHERSLLCSWSLLDTSTYIVRSLISSEQLNRRRVRTNRTLHTPAGICFSRQWCTQNYPPNLQDTRTWCFPLRVAIQKIRCRNCVNLLRCRATPDVNLKQRIGRISVTTPPRNKQTLSCFSKGEFERFLLMASKRALGKHMSF